MPRVDFYVLSGNAPDVKLRIACRLAQKIYTLGKSAYLYAESADQAQRLDNLMWTFDQSSFIPHCIRGLSESEELQAPITIGHESPSESASDEVLISLLDRVPENVDRFDRIVELVTNEPSDRVTARKRYSYYRDNGFELETHELSV